jgi:DNA-binding response OmpR family regulator
MILVVDDDKRIVEMLKTLLEDDGYTVETASDGAEAHEIAGSPECECIVLDINMPNFNGPSLLLVLQSEGVQVPVIVVTGEHGFSLKEMQQFENVVAFLEKPVAGDAFMAAVKQHARAAKG